MSPLSIFNKIVFFFFYNLDRVSLGSPGYGGTGHVKQTGLKFTAILPLLPKRGGHEPPRAHWDTFISCRCMWPVGPALLVGGL